MLASCETEVSLPDGVALHARPAAVFVKTAMRFKAAIEVRANERVADAKSILSVLALGARGGTVLHVEARGEDAQQALGALAASVAALTE